MIFPDDDAAAALQQLERDGLLRRPVRLASPCSAHIVIDGQTVINAASNNVLGLADDPRIIDAARDAALHWGVGAGASRLVCGDMDIHAQAERELAALKHCEEALIFPTGYMANVGIITALVGKGDTLLADHLSHASLIDGARLSGARLRTFAHNDVDHLRTLLAKPREGHTLVVTESIFSMDGDRAPLPDLVSACEEAMVPLMVDEAHATGILGEHGGGAIEAFHLEGRVPIVMGTLSKALGAMGGFVAGTHSVIEYIRQRARSGIYTTGISPIIMAAVIEAIRIVRTEPERRATACCHARTLYDRLSEQRDRFHPQTFLQPPAAHILPVIVGENAAALALSRRLLAHGILAPAIRPPTVPKGTARLRVSCMATHSREDIDRIATALLAD